MEAIKITVKCMGCGKKKTVGKEQAELPICDCCFMPMIAEKVTTKKK